jgi:hypothetical protein
MAKNLTDFLIDNPVDDITDAITVSKRLKEYPFTIKAMDGLAFAEYRKLSTKIDPKKKTTNFDQKKFNELVVINHTTIPNFKDANDIKKAKVINAEQYMYKSLLAGEIAELAEQISTLSGFSAEAKEDIEDEAKNS